MAEGWKENKHLLKCSFKNNTFNTLQILFHLIQAMASFQQFSPIVILVSFILYILLEFYFDILPSHLLFIYIFIHIYMYIQSLFLEYNDQ